MKTRYLMYTLVVVFVVWVLIARFVHVAKISLKVVDEEGRPLEGAKIQLCFYGGCLTNDATNGVTDKNGLFSAIGSSKDGETGGVVNNEGYYNSAFGHDFFVKSSGMWQPWNKQIKVVLRPIVNPVPMYVRNRTFQLPAINTDLGFDLMRADWLPPYGTGAQRDFIIHVDRTYTDYDNFDATLTISFLNKYDGIQLIKDNRGVDFSVGSVFRLARQAPLEGYQPKLVKRVSSGSYGFRAAKEEDNNYIFRVRSEVEDGKLKRAMYGKILGDIRFGPIGGNGGFELHYYLNPDYTTNLEFDPKKNLFTNLPEVEGVGLP